MAVDVFVSYKREERHLAERVVAHLQQAGFVAINDLNIARNEDFADAIDRMIRAARATVVLWTKASSGSPWVRKEARLARKLEEAGKPNAYVGVMVEPLGLDLAFDLASDHMLDLSATGLTRDGLQQILAAVQKAAKKAPDLTPALAATQSVDIARELDIFQMAAGLDTVEAYAQYLRAFPEGTYSADARRRQTHARRWYLRPLRKGNLANTIAAVSVTIAAATFAYERMKPADVVGGISPTVHAAVEAEREAAKAAAMAANEKADSLASALREAEGKATKSEAELAAKSAIEANWAADGASAAASAARAKESLAAMTASRDAALAAAKKKADIDAASYAALNATVAGKDRKIATLERERDAAARERTSAVAARDLAVDRLAKAEAEAKANAAAPDVPAAGKPVDAVATAGSDAAPPPDCEIGGEKGYDFAGTCVPLTATSVDLSKNRALSDISSLRFYTKMESLKITGTEVSDLKPLAELKRLRELTILGSKVVDLSPISGLEKLKFLEAGNTDVNDISALSMLSELRTLSLQRTKISSIAPLSGMPSLGALLLNNSSVSDLSGLKSCPALIVLNLDGTKPLSLEPLLSCANLEVLTTPDGVAHKGRYAVVKEIKSWKP